MRFSSISSQLLFFEAAAKVGPSLFFVEPGISRRVFSGVVGVEIDEDPLNPPIADLKDIAPAAGSMIGNAGAPGTVAVLAVARPFRDEDILARKNPIEVRVVMDDRLDRTADVAEKSADLLLAGG